MNINDFCNKKTLAFLTISVLSLIGGRISVDTPTHEEECAPELASVLAGNEALARCRQDVTDAEARGLEACVEREQRICAERVIAGGRADDALDCLVCETRCRVTE